MDHVTTEQLQVFFQRYGWQFEVMADGSCKTGWQGERQFYPLKVSISSVCVTFEVRPFLYFEPLSESAWREWPPLASELLELNHGLKLVKLTASCEGELALICQVLAVGFTYTAFARILEVLGYYADVLFDELTPRLMSRGYLGRPRSTPFFLS